MNDAQRKAMVDIQDQGFTFTVTSYFSMMSKCYVWRIDAVGPCSDGKQHRFVATEKGLEDALSSLIFDLSILLEAGQSRP